MDYRKNNCPVCLAATQRVGSAAVHDYHTRKFYFKTPIYHCQSCDSFYRDIAQSDLVEFLNTASFVNLDYEDKILRERQKFLTYLLELSQKYLPADRQYTTLADFGSGHGHLLEIAKKKGFQAIGIDQNQELVNYCNQKGLRVVNTLKQLKEPVDVFTIIDSLYYVPQPRETVRQIVDQLKPGGLIIIRVSNRHHFLRTRNFFKHDNDYSILGDAIVSFSVKSITKLFTDAGMEVVELLPDTGQGKEIASAATWIVYKLSAFATKIMGNRMILSPGVIFIARKI